MRGNFSAQQSAQSFFLCAEDSHDLTVNLRHFAGDFHAHHALSVLRSPEVVVELDMATKPEYEANIVAAEILLDSDEILEYIYDYGYTSEQIARAMHTDINLVALKIAHLAETGHKLRRMEYRSSFLK